MAAVGVTLMGYDSRQAASAVLVERAEHAMMRSSRTLLAEGQWLVFGLIILVLVSELRPLAAYFRLNQVAVQTTSMCLNGHGEETRPAATAESSQLAWFTAVSARCRGDADSERQSWQSVVAGSGARIQAIRAAAPADTHLAQLAAATHPQLAEGHFWLGDVLKAQGDIVGAIQAYAAGLALRPNDAKTWLALGELFLAQDDWRAAAQAYDRACLYVDQGKNGCPRAGQIYLDQGMYDLAAQRYRDSLGQVPGWAPARLGLARALLGLGESEEAARYLEPLAAEGNAEAQQLLYQLSGMSR